METKVRKWGKSLAIRIPADLAASVGISVDSPIALERRGDVLVIVPLTMPSRRRGVRRPLAEYLAEMTPDNRQAEISTGAARGREIL